METTREFMKGGANVHVKSHYRILNGKMVYVHEHDKAGQIGHEAQLHERVGFGKNKAHLQAIDPEDRDTVLKHAGQLGLKPEVKYQGGKIRDHEGNVKPHGFHYLKFDNEEDAAKVHASISAESKGGEKTVDAPAQQQEPEQPEGKVGTHPNDAVKEAEKKLQSFIDFGHSSAIKSAVEGKDTTPEQATAMLKVLDGGLKVAEETVAAADAYEKETGQPAPNADTYKSIVAKMNEWKAALEAKAKPAEAATKAPKGEADNANGPTMGLTAQQSVIDPSGKKWDVIKASKDHGDVVLEDANGKKLKATQAQLKEKGYKVAEEPRDDIEESTGMPDPKEDAQGQITDLMAEAEKNFNADPAKASEALKLAADLAEKHGLKHTHENGKEYDAAWMKDMAGKIDEAMPKPPPVDEEYAQHAKDATEASAAAHEDTKSLKADFQNGEHTPEKAESTMKGHATAGNKHVKAMHAHKKAAEKAPTPELAAFHEKKAQEHNTHAEVHATAMEMSAKQHDKNKKHDAYNTAEGNAAVASETANASNVASQQTEDHLDAKKLHDDAAKAHTGAIQHALADGDEKAALHHAAKATEHQKKAAYHDAAHEAWAATNANHHEGASQLHEIASAKAKEVGPEFEHAAAQHDDFAAGHKKQAKPSIHPDYAPHADKAMAASKQADESGTAEDHHKATLAHLDAKDAAEKIGASEAAAHHAGQAEKHSKSSSEAYKKEDFDKKHTKAIQLTDNAHSSGSYGDHVAAAEAHNDAHKAAKEVHGEDSDEAKLHLKLNQMHGEKANEAHAKLSGEAPESSNPFKGKNHMAISGVASDAYANGDFAEAAKHYKHAAVVAHHNGDMEQAKHLATLAKESLAKVKPMQKAVNPQACLVSIQEAARQLHQERQAIRFLAKAMKDLPAAAKLQAACANATQAGITDIKDIVANAVGGKASAAPYLAFLASVNQ